MAALGQFFFNPSEWAEAAIDVIVTGAVLAGSPGAGMAGGGNVNDGGSAPLGVENRRAACGPVFSLRGRKAPTSTDRSATQGR